MVRLDAKMLWWNDKLRIERERERERERIMSLKGIEGSKDFSDLINKQNCVR